MSDQGQTLENQLPDVERIIGARRLELVATYTEKESAAKPRDEFERMMRDARAGHFGVLVVWAVDRFGRSMLGNLTAIRELERVGVDVISARESWLDTTGPVRDVLLAFISWIAEQERRRIGERTIAGMARARQQGKAIGRPRARVDANALELLLARRRTEGLTREQMAKCLDVSPRTLRRELERRRLARVHARELARLDETIASTMVTLPFAASDALSILSVSLKSLTLGDVQAALDRLFVAGRCSIGKTGKYTLLSPKGKAISRRA